MSKQSTRFTRVLAIALLASTALSAAVPTFAASNNDRDRDDRRRYDYDSRNDRNDSQRYNSSHRAWARGQTLPREYRREDNIYRGWRDDGLRAPPRGSQWLRIGGQFVLVSMRTGKITEIRLVQPRVVRSDDRDDKWRRRYNRSYSYSDDVAYTECRSQPDPAGVLAGAFLGAIVGNAAAGRHDRGGATAAGVIAGGAIGAALTSKMDCSDRSYAYQTYSLGFNGGRANAVYRWDNPQSKHRGEMHVLDYYNDEDDFRCAVFSQTVYINNRPEQARGRACQQPNGTWAIID